MEEQKGNSVKHKTQRTAQVEGGRIRNKLTLWFLLLSLIPTAVMGFVGYTVASRSLHDKSFGALKAVRTTQQRALKNYFSERVSDMQALVDNVSVLQQKAFEMLAAVKLLKAQQVKKYMQGLLRDLEEFAAAPVQQASIVAFNASRGKKAGSASKNAVSRYGSVVKKFQAGSGFDSLMLVARSGVVLYSTDKKINPGANLLSKSFNDTVEQKAFKNGFKEGMFTDFKESELHDNAPVAYVSAPVKSGSKIYGVIMARFSPKGIDEIMERESVLGKTGETYLVGPDKLFRSDSPYFKESLVANPAFVVDSESADNGLKGQKGEGVVINYRGEYVLSSYMPLNIKGLNWVIIAEIEQPEAFASALAGKKEDLLTLFAKRYGYSDLYLFNVDGYLFYSVKHRADFRTNMLSGPYKDSNLSALLSKVLNTKKLAVSDYKIYKPAHSPAAFVAMPLLYQNKVVLVAAFQVPIDQINAIMHSHAGLGKTEDAYLVGPDGLLRSEVSYEKGAKTSILNPSMKVNTKAVKQALEGKSGTGIVKGLTGEVVFSSWAPFKFKDLTWALITEVSKSEIDKPVKELAYVASGLFAAAVIAVLFAAFLVSGGLTKQVDQIMKVIEGIRRGKQDVRADVVSRDELGAMASAFNEMLDRTQELVNRQRNEHEALQESIISLLTEISDLAEGDLTVHATVRDDATGTLADSLNLMVDQFKQVIRDVKDKATTVGEISGRLSKSTGELSEHSELQAHMVSDSIEEINLMAKTIKEAAQNAASSAQASEQSMNDAAEGANTVARTSNAMESIRSNVQDTARAIKRLGESSQEIREIVKIINEIAERTSILALNASIQASAAGEEGRGFGVVAEEIQRLAERAGGSTKQIETLINNILNEIGEAATSMDASIQRVVEGTKLSDEARQKLQNIAASSKKIAVMIQSISDESKKHATASARISATMKKIGVISSSTEAETKKISEAMNDMANVANEMIQSVETFKLEDEEGKRD